MSSLLSLIESEISDDRRGLFTQFPAKVIDYQDQLTTIKPLISMRMPDGDIVELGELRNVPVIFSSGGGVIISHPIQTNQTVWVECSMFEMENWLQQYSDNVIPNAKALHQIKDAVVTGVLYSNDKRLGVDNTHSQWKWFEVDDQGNPSGEWLNSITLLNDKSIEILTSNNQSVKLLADKSIVIESTDAGNKIELLADGNIEYTSAGTFKIQNGSEELVNLLSEVVDLLATGTTTNTSIGPMPLNSASQLAALKTRIDTLKG